MEDNKLKALTEALKQINKKCGAKSVMRMGDEGFVDIEAISTGSIGLDSALGIQGLPRGRIVEIYGPESSGKTSLSLLVLAKAQEAGGTVVFVDAEHALDVKYAERLGVDMDHLYLSQPDSGEQALEIVDTMASSGAVDVIVVDSVAALTPKAEIEGDIGSLHVGLQSRLMSQAMRKLSGTVARTKTLVIFINQIRMKIGVVWGNPETTSGGNALKFYASVRLDVRRIGVIKNGADIVGSETRVKVVKNKVAPPFKQAEFILMYNEGVSYEDELITFGLEHGVLEKSGSWYSFGGTKLGNGKDAVREYLKSDPQVALEIHRELPITESSQKDRSPVRT